MPRFLVFLLASCGTGCSSAVTPSDGGTDSAADVTSCGPVYAATSSTCDPDATTGSPCATRCSECFPAGGSPVMGGAVCDGTQWIFPIAPGGTGNTCTTMQAIYRVPPPADCH